MRLLIKQKIFSILDSFMVYDENEEIYLTVKSEFDLFHHFHIYDREEKPIGELVQKFALLPKFEMYKGGKYFGTIRQEFTFFVPKYHIEAQDYNITGDIFHWDFQVMRNGIQVGIISKQLFHLADTYIIDVQEDCAIDVLMIVLAIDAIQCSKNKDS